MREEPTSRIPIGILSLTVGLIVYGIIIARYLPDLIGHWHALLQTIVYLFLGIVWLLPLRNFLIWMETGHWGTPPDDGE